MMVLARFVLLVFLGTAPSSAAPGCRRCFSSAGCASDLSDHVSVLQTRTAVVRQPGGNASLPAKPARRRPAPRSAAEVTGVRANTAGDLDVLLSGLLSNAMMTLVFVLGFMALRARYPLMFSNNVLNGTAPRTPRASTFGWLEASLSTTVDEAAESIGLDNALLLEFLSLCMRITWVFGLPLVLVMCPLHFVFGGGEAQHKSDWLGRFGMSNVATGHPWLYYVHAAVVWFVSQTTQRMIYAAQKDFLKRRATWLKALPYPRANTVLVEGIPPDYRSDAMVRKFFADVFSPEQITSVAVVKHTEELERLVASRASARMSRSAAEQQLERRTSPEEAQTLIESCTQQLERLDAEISAERERLNSLSTEAGGINSSTAFVTFASRRDAELAKELMYTPDDHEWIVSIPPEPSSIRWADFRQNPNLEVILSIVGYAGLAGLYIGFMPICVFITNISYAIEMPGCLNDLWKSLAPTLGLTLFLSFLPTVMIILFRECFTLKADVWAQQRLQVWYFWFQVVFVLLVTAVGDDVISLARNVALQPLSVFELLAGQLPKATHFYMNYLVLQWSTESSNLLRYFPLAKFLTARAIWNDDQARELAEPEDQDYYGIGSRSARLTIIMLVGLVFSTLSPLVAVFAWLTLALCRVWYGYLLVFAETRKPDLGGAFWATKLVHLQLGNIIYCILMTGVLAERAPNHVPAAIAAGALLYTVWSYVYYLHAFHWEKLAFTQIPKSSEAGPQIPDTKETYIQPELLDG